MKWSRQHEVKSVPKVFVSHSVKDREFVEYELIRPLQRHGIETWYSKDAIDTGARWEKEIVEGLKSCDWFLVVLSRESVQSDWVEAEVHWAMDERANRIVPVLIDDCDPADLHLKLRQVQFVDYRENRDQAKKKLLTVWNVDFKSRAGSGMTTQVNLYDDDGEVAYVRSPHELRLVQGAPESVGSVYPITAKHVIGRCPPSDFQIKDSAVGRRHAEIVLDEQGCVRLRDVGSRNGTRVNGSFVNEVQLHDGDEICIGATSFVYRAFSPEQIGSGD